MPLSMAKTGEELLITRIGGKQEIRLFLENLGFTVGSTVTVVNEISGNVIVSIRESRVAISSEMARKIIVSPCNPAQALSL